GGGGGAGGVGVSFLGPGRQRVGWVGGFREPHYVALRVVPGWAGHGKLRAPAVVRVVAAAALHHAGLPLLRRDRELRDREWLRDRDAMLRPFVVVAVLLARRRAHREAAGRHHDHLGTLAAFAKRLARRERALALRRKPGDRKGLVVRGRTGLLGRRGCRERHDRHKQRQRGASDRRAGGRHGAAPPRSRTVPKLRDAG